MKQLSVFALAVLFSLSAISQEITISGQVTDNNSEPLIGASIVESGTNNGVTTDFDGNFSMTVSGAESEIVCVQRLEFGAFVCEAPRTRQAMTCDDAAPLASETCPGGTFGSHMYRRQEDCS